MTLLPVMWDPPVANQSTVRGKIKSKTHEKPWNSEGHKIKGWGDLITTKFASSNLF